MKNLNIVVCPCLKDGKGGYERKGERLRGTVDN